MKLSSGTLVLGVFAVLFGLVGAYAAKQHLAEKPMVEPAAEGRISVPMAAMDLPAGRTISMGDVIVRELTREQIRALGLPSGFMNQASQLSGRTLRVDIPKGLPFTPEDLYPVGTGPSVAERLQPGYRAVAVALENSQSEMSLLSPGAVVDVMFRTFASRGIPETTVTLLEGVEVLAIGDQMFPGGKPDTANNGRRQAPAVTLAVTPDQASALKVIEGRGSLSLVLRGRDDRQLVGNTPPQTMESLLHLPAPKPPVMTHVYRRGRLTTSVFEDGGRVAVTEGFNGFPVSADSGGTNVAPVSYVRAGSERAAAASAAASAERTSGASGSGSGSKSSCKSCGNK